jgi:addiction module HigA family antidote
MSKNEKLLPPIHPGEILREDFLKPLQLMNKLAMDLHVPVTRIAEIIHERRGITPDTALRDTSTPARVSGSIFKPPTIWR